MSELAYYMVGDCYAVFICILIVGCFLIINKSYEKDIRFYFSLLIFLVAIESGCGAYERYLASRDTYSYLRVPLSWACYLAAPAITLVIIQISMRNRSKKIRCILCIPQFINVVITSLAFFTKWVFYYTADNNGFHNGPLGFVPRVTLILYLFVLIIVGIMNVRKSKWECLIVLSCVIFVLLNFWNEYRGVVNINLRGSTIAISILTYFMYFTSLRYYDEVETITSTLSQTEQEVTKQMIDQTIETLAYTIDAKDRYTRGHSFRVAKYAHMIAKMDGKSDQECREIYLAGLLHDIGKISISDSIINKAGKLTEEEFAKMNTHPSRGAKILDNMRSFPELQNGAKYHHERFDGNGYPSGLMGNEIPEMARIIAVADAYDAMTSHRSYRETMSQSMAKQEIWKGMGTQFDPHFAKIMISLIDADINFDLREKPGELEKMQILMDDVQITWGRVAPKGMREDGTLMQETNYESFGAYVHHVDHWREPDESYLISDKELCVDFFAKTNAETPYVWHSPAMIMFASKSGAFLDDDYDELGVFLSAAYSWRTGAKIQTKTSFSKTDKFVSWDNWIEKNKEGMMHQYRVIREGDSIHLIISNELLIFKIQIELANYHDQNIYFVISGERCEIS